MTEAAEHLEQGVMAFKAGDYDTAIDHLEMATRDDPDSYRGFNYLGAAYAGKGKYNAAIGAFKSAEQINPNAPSLRYNLGQAYEAAGVPAEAEHEYQAALLLDPGYTRAQDALVSLRERFHKQADINSSAEL